ISLILWLSNCQQYPSQLTISTIFADHMVLQQNTKVAIWGTATANSSISIEGSWGNSGRTATNLEGKWQIDLPTPKAGGPFELSISAHDTTININDIFIGEVWLCSGQSNMEMPLKGWPPNDPIQNSAEEIAKANYPQIRMFTVQKALDITPTTEYTGSWAVCNPANVPEFSATAYFFGRKLYEELNVPIGLIHSSWGGTPAEAWTEGKYLANLSDYETVLEKIEQAVPQQKALNEWLSAKRVSEIAQSSTEDDWNNLDFQDNELISGKIAENTLTNIKLPVIWEDAQVGLNAFDGTILFRKDIIIPNEFLNQDLVVELGPIDDMDATYFNGVEIGKMLGSGHWNTKRVYNIPKSLTSQNKNLLSIRVIDTGGGGGFGGNPKRMKIYVKGNTTSAINIGGEGWNYLPLAEYRNGKFYHYAGTVADFKERPSVDIELNANAPTVLYNAMIAPIVPYSMKGAIWYQGESNVNRAKQYETLFPTMIESWRAAWGQGDFPFYFTQIAPYNYGDVDGIQSAQLREAQRKSLNVPNTGMAVTLDIGNNDNIHPANKLDVGERLAYWALAKDYGQSAIDFTGPLFKAAKVNGNQMIVSFGEETTELIAKSNPLEGFEIAGTDEIFFPAKATISGLTVVVSSAQVKAPAHVRYAFKNGSTATLFDEKGLPASSFSSEGESVEE
ncbi:MAG: sialate O-acetylesterase, partial [Bacteroidota bacterium]